MLNVAKSFLAERYDFIAYTTSRPARREAAKTHGYSTMLSGGILRLIAAAFITFWHIAKFPFSLIFSNPVIVQVQASDFQAFWEAIIYVFLGRLFHRPVALRLGGAFDHFYQESGPRAEKLIRRALLWPDILIVQSEYWRIFVAGIGRSDRVLVLPNAVPDAMVSASDELNNPTPICLFSAGTEADRKGISEVLAAMRALKERGIKVKFRLFAMLPHAQELVLRYGLSEMAEIEGYVDHDRMLAAMRTSDIFLLPSRGEGFPNALLEAMAAGLASIVTPVGAVPEIVGNDGALIVPARDALMLADAIKQLVENPSERAMIGHRAREIVVNRYTQRNVLPILHEAWQSMLT